MKSENLCSLKIMVWKWIKASLKFVRSLLPMLTGRRPPTVFVEGNAVVIATETTGVNAGHTTVMIKRPDVPGNISSQNGGPIPQVDYYARGNGVILADRHTDGTAGVMEVYVV